jgi:hypothetical protein
LPRLVQSHFSSDGGQPHIRRKESDAVVECRREQMDVDPAYSAPVKKILLHKRNGFEMWTRGRPRKKAVSAQNRQSAAGVANQQFAVDEFVTANPVLQEQAIDFAKKGLSPL